jgi:hypothetical protein
MLPAQEHGPPQTLVSFSGDASKQRLFHAPCLLFFSELSGRDIDLEARPISACALAQPFSAFSILQLPFLCRFHLFLCFAFRVATKWDAYRPGRCHYSPAHKYEALVHVGVLIVESLPGNWRRRL